jgi:hypothetical protein
MKALGRLAVWVAVILLALAAISWAGLVLIAPYFFLVPAIAIVILIGYVTILTASQKKTAADPGANQRD